MTHFYTTLTGTVQRQADDYMDMHPSCTWEQFKVAFKKHYREQQMDEQVYATLKTLKQGDNDRVEDYYECFMKLIRCLQTTMLYAQQLQNWPFGLSQDYNQCTEHCILDRVKGGSPEV